ncbi:unnamed protein product [Brachionus calyciflorus]|uniref:Uncharacterized protein n=1 Tax=Brachionus calyciflorus TaxID=104777 RepID=A0A814Q9K0_9BILA|nr:unnamed protein product [Brachionus calyciflorus]
MEKTKEKLVTFMVVTNQPNSLVEHNSFREFYQELNSNYNPPCRATYRNSFLLERYQVIKSYVQAELNKITKCSISADTWTYINVILCLEYLNNDHNSQYLYDKLIDIVKSWSITEKLIGATSDSGANFKAAIELFPEKTLKLLCAGHKLNLCVNDIFKIKNISEKNGKYFIFDFNEHGDLRKQEINIETKNLIENDNKIKNYINCIIKKCKHLVGSVKYSESLERNLKNVQKQLNYRHSKKLIQEVCTRWGSTFDLLMSIIINKDALNTMKYDPTCQCISNYVSNESDYEAIEELCTILDPLKELTTIFSSRNYVSITHLFPTIYYFLNKEFESIVFKNEKVERLKEILIESLEKRFKYLFKNDVFKAITYLDPSYKNFEFISDSFDRKTIITETKLFLKDYYSKQIKKNVISPPSNQTDQLLTPLDSFSRSTPLSSSDSSTSSTTISSFQTPKNKPAIFLYQILKMK